MIRADIDTFADKGGSDGYPKLASSDCALPNLVSFRIVIPLASSEFRRDGRCGTLGRHKTFSLALPTRVQPDSAPLIDGFDSSHAPMTNRDCPGQTGWNRSDFADSFLARFYESL